MKKISSINPRLYMYVSFFLLGIAMVWDNSVWLIFIALLPLIAYLPHINKSSSRQVFKDFYFAGFILCGFANLFLFQVAPENWTIQLNGWFGIVSRFMSWVFICSLCAVSYGLLGFVLKKTRNNLVKLLLLPFLFPIAELIRSYLFALMAYGPHGSLSPNFNWGSISVPASGTPLVYTSRMFGFFGLSFFVVLINISLYLLLFKRRVLVPILTLGIVLSFTLIGWSLGEQTTSKTIRVAAVHMNEESDMTSVDRINWPPEGTDILVLPEYSAILKYKNYKQMLKQLTKNGVAITTIDTGRSPRATNRIVYLNRNGEIINSQDKTFLIPTGEYVPYSLQLGFRAIGKSSALVDFRYSQQLVPGTEPEKPFETNGGISIGALACSGVSALNEYTGMTNSGAEILTNSASLAFLQPNSLYHTYARNMARFQTVSNNRPFVQASRSGQSYILDNQGRSLAESSGQNDQIISGLLQY